MKRRQFFAAIAAALFSRKIEAGPKRIPHAGIVFQRDGSYVYTCRSVSPTAVVGIGIFSGTHGTMWERHYFPPVQVVAGETLSMTVTL